MSRSTSPEPVHLRISLTLPGSASLGAYQAGAMSALATSIVELRSQGHDVCLDAVGGSSAGSIVATIGAHCLVTGRDTTNMLRRAWVDEVDIDLLRASGSEAPLHIGDLRDDLVDFLSDEDKHPYDVHDPLRNDILLEVGLTSLRGLRRATEMQDRQISTLDYADWSRHVLSGGGDHSDVIDPKPPSKLALLDAMLASAAHPVAFTPQLLDRSDDADFLARASASGLDDFELWYTDGGLVESEPVGRIVRAARESGAGPGRRVHIVVDPRSSGPSGDPEWSDPKDEKSWLDGLRRSISIVPTQALHDDLRQISETNGALDRLEDAVASLRSDHDVDDDLAAAIRAALTEVAGLDEKEHVHVEMITPLVEIDSQTVGDDRGVNDMLAGDFAGAFGGFLSRRIRRSDYALGWKSFRDWIDDGGLERHGIDDDSIASTLEALAEQRPVDVEHAILGGADDGVEHLGATGRLRLALLAGRFARVAVSQATPTPSIPFPDRNGGATS